MPLLPNPTAASPATDQEAVRRYHSRPKGRGQCGAVHVQHIEAPLPVVWSVVRHFDRPQSYKLFLPARTSTERLDALDDERHVTSFSIVGGDHRLRNYQATTSLHEAASRGGGGGGGGGGGTVVVESYVVDVPPGSTAEDTCVFADTIVGCNLRSLASVAERIARSQSSSNGI